MKNRCFARLAAVCACCAITPGLASAQDRVPLQLDWDAPAACPDQAQVVARVQGYLKLERWPAGTSVKVVAKGRVARRDGALALELEVRAQDVTTQRTLVDADCDALGSGAALLIALALGPLLEPQQAGTQAAAPSPESEARRPARTDVPTGPDAAAPTPRPARSATPSAAPTHAGDTRNTAPGSSEPAPSTEPESAAASTATRTTPRALLFAVGAGAWLAGDLMPAGPAIGLELAGDVRFRPWRAGLGLALSPARSDRAGGYPSAQLRLSSAMLVVWPCYELPADPLTVGLCLYGELGRVDASVRSIVEPQSTHARWLAGGAGLSLGYAATRHLIALVEGRIVRAAEDLHFVISTPGGEVELHHTGPLSARLSLRIEWQF